MNRSPRVPLLIASIAAASSPLAAQTALTTTRIASGLSQPLWCGQPAGDESRLFIAEQATGRIRILRGGALLATPFVTVTGILTGSERGLLGVAFHPNYRTNGYFYVNYTRAGDGATMVDRFTVSANPDVANVATRTTILGPIAQPFSNHNGGNVVFGPDGYLYIGMGDGGSAGDPACRAQTRTELLGKMLRIDVDGGTPYAIPPTNPFAGSTAWRQEIWALGLRNPWRWAFDRLTGDLYIGDVGQNAVEEIDFQPASSAGGENYGWKMMEGASCYSTTACPNYIPACNTAALSAPLYTYSHSSGCSVTGGVVYRGCAIPDLRGAYFFGDYCNNAIWSLRQVGGAVTDFRNRTAELAPGGGLTINSPVHFGEDARGEILIVDLGGEVFKIVPRLPAPAANLGNGLLGSNGLTPALDMCGLLHTGSSADLRLRFGPAGTVGVLCLSFTGSPTPIFGGVLVPFPLDLTMVVILDPAGGISFPVMGGGGVLDLYAQYLMWDAGLTEQVGFSNALRITFQP
jgi:glucose/arabinose dehydrogenase